MVPNWVQKSLDNVTEKELKIHKEEWLGEIGADAPAYLVMIYKTRSTTLNRLTVVENHLTQLLYIMYRGWY